MKRTIFTLLVIISAGLVTTAYSQVSIHASINIGRTGIYVKSAPVVYEQPVCTPPPPPPAPCYDNVYDRGRVDVVIGKPGYDRRYYGRKEIRYDERRDRDYRDRDRRDFDHDRDHRR